MEIIEQLRSLLRGGKALESFEESIEVLRSLPHGHIAAAFGTIIKTGLDQLISPENSRELSLILAKIVARIIDPQSKLATARGLDPETASSSLGEIRAFFMCLPRIRAGGPESVVVGKMVPSAPKFQLRSQLLHPGELTGLRIQLQDKSLPWETNHSQPW
jgi:hypothetical protein